MNRRHLLGLLAGTPPFPILARPVRRRLRELPFGAYVLPALHADLLQSGDKGIAYSGIIAGTDGVLVVDPGPHFGAGISIAHTVQRELGLPVVGVINTHAAPEYVLGNAAFPGMPIYASATTRRLMASRCSACLQRLTNVLGRRAMEGTAIVLPNQTLETGNDVRVQGITLDVRVFDHAHSPGDLAVFDHRSKAIFGGALAYSQRIPDMQEASVYGWLQAIDTLRQWPARWFVGAGFGAPDDTVLCTQQYLQSLEQQIAAQIRRGGEPAELLRPGVNPPWARWAGFRSRHALNIQRTWREMEDLWWKGALPG